MTSAEREAYKVGVRKRVEAFIRNSVAASERSLGPLDAGQTRFERLQEIGEGIRAKSAASRKLFDANDSEYFAVRMEVLDEILADIRKSAVS